MAEKTRRGIAVYNQNPFVFDVQSKTKRVTNKTGDMVMINKETGEIASDIAGFWQSEEVDSTQFVKLFVNGVKALKGLTQAGTKVFEVLYNEVQKNISVDLIYLSYSHVNQDLTPMSESTYTRGMRELIQKEFIAASESQGLYWLNPSFVWNGDRLAFIKSYHKRTPTTDLPNKQLPLIGEE
jgi:hypothetical protein